MRGKGQPRRLAELDWSDTAASGYESFHFRLPRRDSSRADGIQPVLWQWKTLFWNKNPNPGPRWTQILSHLSGNSRQVYHVFSFTFYQKYSLNIGRHWIGIVPLQRNKWVFEREIDQTSNMLTLSTPKEYFFKKSLEINGFLQYSTVKAIWIKILLSALNLVW